MASLTPFVMDEGLVFLYKRITSLFSFLYFLNDIFEVICCGEVGARHLYLLS